MLKLVLLSFFHCLTLCAGQVFLKISLSKTGPFRFSWGYFKDFLSCWQWAACGASFLTACILWMYILKRYEFSLAYPITSMTFVFSILAGFLVFGEAVSVNKWVGVGLITLGIIVIAAGGK